jgi:hypothetical protein
MVNILSRYHSDRYADGRMGENQEKGKEYDSTLSCIFDIIMSQVNVQPRKCGTSWESCSSRNP